MRATSASLSTTALISCSVIRGRGSGCAEKSEGRLLGLGLGDPRDDRSRARSRFQGSPVAGQLAVAFGDLADCLSVLSGPGRVGLLGFGEGAECFAHPVRGELAHQSPVHPADDQALAQITFSGC